jgi:tRNA A64-2'-O-ribosylphosphate transferase
MADTFPTTVAHLNFRDETVVPQSLYRSMRDLRRATLSIPNRLRSILRDADFVQHVVTEQSPEGSKLPLIANERCGSWYIPPDRKAGSAYFKSTDGHFGQWDFSLRRLNLQVLSIVGKYGGAVIVDSTRRGKSMPDAFAKTVPIWVMVMNIVLFPDVPESHTFQQPPEPYGLGHSEVSQIEKRLDGFVKALRSLNLDLQGLRQELDRPMKLSWRVNGSTTSNRALRHDSRSEVRLEDYHPVILCSASRRVLGAEMSEAAYIQGAGDDSEGWSRGLTPTLFWQHKDALLNTPESELENLIQVLIANARKDRKGMVAVRIAPTSNLYIVKASIDDLIVPTSPTFGANATPTEDQWGNRQGHKAVKKFDMVISCSKGGVSHPGEGGGGGGGGGGGAIDLACRTGKLGSRDLRDKLGPVQDFVKLRLKRDPTASILITCETGRDLCVGVALMLLCLFYDDEGNVMLRPDPRTFSEVDSNGDRVWSSVIETIDKSFIRRRLAWIVSSHSDANPSRTTLQSINGFLMERPN